jgi:ferrochelatase
MNALPYDAILIASFGGPEGPADVMPFLDNVLRGRNIPDERKREVAHHYDLFGGVSPINAQNRKLQAALEQDLRAHNIHLPVYLGNRNWHPLFADTLRAMKERGVRKFLTFVTSAFSCYSGCRQYREDIENARQAMGAGAPAFDKIRVCYNHPGFIEVWRENVRSELTVMPDARVVFTAHSIPLAMADRCDYVAQLKDACHLVAETAGIAGWDLVYQSRSGAPHQPWLEPDILDHLRRLHADGVREVLIAPIGFVSDHMEVLYDLDHEARALCEELGMRMLRARTPETHPRFVAMVRELIEERMDSRLPKRTLGARGPKEDVCPANCCLSGRPH